MQYILSVEEYNELVSTNDESGNIDTLEKELIDLLSGAKISAMRSADGFGEVQVAILVKSNDIGSRISQIIRTFNSSVFYDR